MTQSTQSNSIAAPYGSINSLQDDILHVVFDLGVPSSFELHDDSQRYDTFEAYLNSTSPRNARGVCRRWRRVVENGPTLWSRFFFTGDSRIVDKLNNLRTVELFIAEHLKNSGSCPLSFEISLRDDRETESFDGRFIQRILSTLSEHQQRWQNVVLDAGVLGSMDLSPSGNRLSVLHPESWKMLKSITLNPQTKYELHGPLVDLPKLPMLSSISLQETTMASVMRLLLVSPNLQDCNVKGAFYLPVLPYSRARKSGPMVGHALLRLQVVKAPAIFNFLDCPYLEKLSVSDLGAPEDSTMQPTIDFLQWSRPPLRSLHLQSRFTVESLKQCLYLVPSLAVLTIDTGKSPTSPLALALLGNISTSSGPDMAPTTLTFVPRLKKLVVHNSAIRLSSFSELVERRWARLSAAEGLKSVELVECWEESDLGDLKLPQWDTEQQINDVPKLHNRWDVVKRCVEEGLHLRIINTPHFRRHLIFP